MAATGILADAVSAVSTVVTSKGYTPVTDPRNIRPFCVFIELPNVTSFTYNVGDIRLIVRVCAPPPGNQDAADYLMTVADALMNSSLAVTDLRPGFVSTGGQDLPTYDLTIAVGVRRN